MLGTRAFILALLVALFGTVSAVAAQDVLSPSTLESLCKNDAAPALIFQREEQVEAIIAGYTATVKTNIQIPRNPFLLVFHASLLHFSDQVDYLQPAQATRQTKGESTGNFLWRFNPSGFANRAFPDQGRFTQNYYQLNPGGLEPCQDQTCCVYQVTPVHTPRNHRKGPFFLGTIWVETDDYTIIRFNGQYVPANHTHPPLIMDHWFDFQSSRIKVAPHLWLPDRVVSRNTGKNRDSFFPEFEAETIFGNFNPR